MRFYFDVSENTHEVVAWYGRGGTVLPHWRQTVTAGSSASFRVASDPGYRVASQVTGSCSPGFWNGDIWITGTVFGDCEVELTFEEDPGPYEVTVVNGVNGTTEPSGLVTAVAKGDTLTVQALPASGYVPRVQVGGDCPEGSWDQDVWESGPILRDCDVVMQFEPEAGSPIVRLLSRNVAGEQGDASSFYLDMTPDGRFVVFASNATNLVANDTNHTRDIFVLEVATGEIERVSVSSSGAQGNDRSSWPVISDDARHVVFESEASNLTDNDGDRTTDVFLHDRDAGTTRLVSYSTYAGKGNDTSDGVDISGNGRFVVFASKASNLVRNNENRNTDIFVLDTQASLQVLERVSVSTGGDEGRYGSQFASISADGRYVAFWSGANNLVDNDTNGEEDIFIRDRESGTTAMVSITDGGAQFAEGVKPMIDMSADGNLIAFASDSLDVVAGDTNDVSDIFLRNRYEGTAVRVSENLQGEEADGPSDFDCGSISSNGRFVVFRSSASNLIPNSTSGSYVRDLDTGEVEQVDVTDMGEAANRGSCGTAVTEDGRYVAFWSHATNLVPDDTNGSSDIFLWDRQGTLPPDTDNDGLADRDDNCPYDANPDQHDLDGDAIGDRCDADLDGDDVPNSSDNCELVVNPEQADADQDGVGDACDDLTDRDGDTIEDPLDNCPTIANQGQENFDGDALGDACDADDDGDGQSDADEQSCGSDPLDAASLAPDLDADDIRDCADDDRDGDDVPNDADPFPADGARWILVDAGTDLRAAPGELVAFSGSFTDPKGSTPHQLAWDFGDGSSADGSLTPSHSFAAEGQYEVRLSITAANCAMASDSLSVQVEEPAALVAWLEPAESSVLVDAAFDLLLRVDSQGQDLGAYTFDLFFDAERLQIDTTQGNNGVERGPDGFDPFAVNANNADGQLRFNGISVNPHPGGDDLAFAIIHLQSQALTGETGVDLVIRTLSDPSGGAIEGSAQGAVLDIRDHLCGDANSDDAIDIVDALVIAQHDALLDPRPFNAAVAEVNGDAVVNIIDALFVARYDVGLPVTVGCLATPDAAATVAADAPMRMATSAIVGGSGSMRLQPSETSAEAGELFALEVRLHADGLSEDLGVGAYRLEIGFDPERLQVEPVPDSGELLAFGPDTLATTFVNLNNEEGSLKVNAFDAAGTPPSADMHLFTVYFRAGANPDDTAISLDVTRLVDTDSQTIGSPSGQGATVSIEPPTITTVQVVELQAGLNLIPLHLIPEPGLSTCEDLYTRLGGADILDSIARFDASQGRWQYCNGAGSGDFGLDAGEAYVVNAIEDHSTEIEGTLACNDLSLDAGLNLRGHPSPQDGLTCRQWLTELGATAVGVIQHIDIRKGRFESCGFVEHNGVPTVAGTNFPIRPDDGYLLHAPAAGTFPLGGCSD